MGETGNGRRVAAEGRGSRLLHLIRVSAQQRVHLAALLTLLFAFSARAGDISFDPAITQEEFHAFSAVMGQAIFPTTVAPAAGRGLLAFDIGVAATAMPVDENASWWVNSVGSDYSTQGYVLVPRIVVSKGLEVATISASYAQIPGSDIKILGGNLDVPIFDGGLIRPTLAIRGSYSQLTGVDEFSAKDYGAELFLSKGFGPITPYGSIGMMRIDTEGKITTPGLETTLTESFDEKRITLGVRLSLLVTKIAVEATQGEDRSYAARFSFGL